MIIVWGKLAGLAFGVFGGAFGAGFGLLVGHLLDVVAADYLLRRALARYLSADGGRIPGQFVRPYASAALTAAWVVGHGWTADPPARASFARAVEALGAPAFSGEAPRRRHARKPLRARPAWWPAWRPAWSSWRQAAWRQVVRRFNCWRAGRYLDAATRVEEEIDPAVLGARLAAVYDRESVRELIRLGLSIAPGAGPATRDRVRRIADEAGIERSWVDGLLRDAAMLDAEACEILGVSRTADLAHVRRAYRTLAAQFHPDTAVALTPEQQSASAQAFVRIRQAYETLVRQLAEPGDRQADADATRDACDHRASGRDRSGAP